uniref:Uncharacterized protein n=1 Tax=Xenopus tropicalis TaxID=8364 RepID=A0A1B8XT58_XENTR
MLSLFCLCNTPSENFCNKYCTRNFLMICMIVHLSIERQSSMFCQTLGQDCYWGYKRNQREYIWKNFY